MGGQPVLGMEHGAMKADEIVTALDQYGYSGRLLEYPYWLCTGGLVVVDFDLLCLACIRKKVAQDALDPRFISGGHGPEIESDSCCHCATCGRLLEYTLSESGGFYELAHFSENLPVTMDRETALHVARMVEAIPEHGEALAIGRRAVEMIPAAAAAD